MSSRIASLAPKLTASDIDLSSSDESQSSLLLHKRKKIGLGPRGGGVYFHSADPYGSAVQLFSRSADQSISQSSDQPVSQAAGQHFNKPASPGPPCSDLVMRGSRDSGIQ